MSTSAVAPIARDEPATLSGINTLMDSVLILLSFGLIVTFMSALWFARREFRVKTPEGN